MMQNAAYQNQLLANAEENQQMRGTEIMQKQQQMAADAYQKAMLEDQHVLEHPDAFPQAVRLNAVNRSDVWLYI